MFVIKFRECGELPYDRRFPLKLKGSVYWSYVRPALQYGRKCDENFTKDREIHGEDNMWNGSSKIHGEDSMWNGSSKIEKDLRI